MRPRKTPNPEQLEQWQLPLKGAGLLWFEDEWGNRWDNNPSEAFFSPDYGHASKTDQATKTKFIFKGTNEMTKHELSARLDDMDRQLAKLFSLCGQNWKQILKRKRDNQPVPNVSNPTQAFGGTYRPKDHERQ